MSYVLGVDLGTTFSAAAVSRAGERGATPVALGHTTNVVPSTVFVEPSGELIVGEAASRRAWSDLSRFVSEFKRRLGDSNPFIIGGRPYSAEDLSGALLRHIVARVVELEGAAPDHVVVTHPATWRDWRISRLHEVVQLAGITTPVAVLAEPEAAAIDYATKARLEPGDLICVYDLGGGTFDAAILENRGTRYRLMGEPLGIDRLGGTDFDHLLFDHVLRLVGLDPGAGAGDAVIARQGATLFQACVGAKMDLSTATSTVLPVVLGGVDTEVRITRTEFEQLIEPAVERTIEALQLTLSNARVAPKTLRAVLLVGGSSRIPCIAHSISEALERPVAIDAHSKHAVAMGAATWGRAQVAAGTAGSAGTGGGRRLDRPGAPRASEAPGRWGATVEPAAADMRGAGPGLRSPRRLAVAPTTPVVAAPPEPADAPSTRPPAVAARAEVPSIEPAPVAAPTPAPPPVPVRSESVTPVPVTLESVSSPPSPSPLSAVAPPAVPVAPAPSHLTAPPEDGPAATRSLQPELPGAERERGIRPAQAPLRIVPATVDDEPLSPRLQGGPVVAGVSNGMRSVPVDPRLGARPLPPRPALVAPPVGAAPRTVPVGVFLGVVALVVALAALAIVLVAVLGS